MARMTDEEIEGLIEDILERRAQWSWYGTNTALQFIPVVETTFYQIMASIQTIPVPKSARDTVSMIFMQTDVGFVVFHKRKPSDGKKTPLDVDSKGNFEIT